MTIKNPVEIQAQIVSVTFWNRTNSAQASLLEDIRAWREKLPKNTLVGYHIDQFHTFCERVFSQLGEEQSEDDLTFRSEVIGTLTTQWLVLREVASLRLEGSPYLAKLDELDKEAARYYHVVLQALPPDTHQYLPASTPLLFLGQASEFTLFNDQDQAPPAIISIPFGAVYDSPQSRSRLAIAHEAGHAVFNRIRPFLPELQSALRTTVDQDKNLSPQQRVLRRVVTKWVGEIVADLVGITLAGPAFANSAFSMLAGPDEFIGFTDETHPVPVIRPYIYLEFFEYINNAFGQKERGAELINTLELYTNSISQLKTNLEIFSDRHLDRRFEALPALTKVNLRQVRDEMRAVTKSVLDTKLKIFDNESFGEILIRSAVNMINADEYPVQEEPLDTKNWGEVIELTTPLVLDLSNYVRPTYGIPVSLGDWACRWLGFC